MLLDYLSSASLLIALAVLVIVWILSYLLGWLHQLEAGARVGSSDAFLENPNSVEKVAFPSLLEPPSKYMTLILPAYEEEARLPVTLDEMLRYLHRRELADTSFTYEILVVDDGSKDRTVELALGYVKKHGLDKVRVIRQGRNEGKGAAVRKGMLCSRGELLLFLDADGATQITDLEKLEAEVKKVARPLLSKQEKSAKGGGMAGIGSIQVAVFGSRAHLEKQALSARKWYRNILTHGFHLCVLLVAGPGIRDTQCGFKMFTRAAARQLFPNQRLKRWCFDVELVYLARRLRIPMREVAVTWTEIPGSKIRITSILHMLAELVLVRLGYGLRLWKIRRSLAQW